MNEQVWTCTCNNKIYKSKYTLQRHQNTVCPIYGKKSTFSIPFVHLALHQFVYIFFVGSDQKDEEKSFPSNSPGSSDLNIIIETNDNEQSNAECNDASQNLSVTLDQLSECKLFFRINVAAVRYDSIIAKLVFRSTRFS